MMSSGGPSKTQFSFHDTKFSALLPPSKFDVFLCYRHQIDTDKFGCILASLFKSVGKELGIHCFRDLDEIENGNDLGQCIIQAIKDSTVFCVLWTSGFCERLLEPDDFVMAEIQNAIETKKHIFVASFGTIEEVRPKLPTWNNIKKFAPTVCKILEEKFVTEVSTSNPSDSIRSVFRAIVNSFTREGLGLCTDEQKLFWMDVKTMKKSFCNAFTSSSPVPEPSSTEAAELCVRSATWNLGNVTAANVKSTIKKLMLDLIPLLPFVTKQYVFFVGLQEVGSPTCVEFEECVGMQDLSQSFQDYNIFAHHTMTFNGVTRMTRKKGRLQGGEARQTGLRGVCSRNVLMVVCPKSLSCNLSKSILLFKNQITPIEFRNHMSSDWESAEDPRKAVIICGSIEQVQIHVSNVHLEAYDTDQSISSQQSRELLASIGDFASNHPRAIFIVLGDFNSIYQHDYHHRHWHMLKLVDNARGYSSQDSTTNVWGNAGFGQCHQLSSASGIRNLEAMEAELPYMSRVARTCWSMRAVDHIWVYCSNRLRIKALFSDVLRRDGSDHWPVLFDFAVSSGKFVRVK